MDSIGVLIDPVSDTTGVSTRIQQILIGTGCTPVVYSGAKQLCPDEGLCCDVVSLALAGSLVACDDLLDLLILAFCSTDIVAAGHLAVELAAEGVCTVISCAVNIREIISTAIRFRSHPDRVHPTARAAGIAPAVMSKLDTAATFIAGNQRHRLCHCSFSVSPKVGCPGKFCAVNGWCGRLNRSQGNFSLTSFPFGGNDRAICVSFAIGRRSYRIFCVFSILFIFRRDNGILRIFSISLALRRRHRCFRGFFTAFTFAFPFRGISRFAFTIVRRRHRRTSSTVNIVPAGSGSAGKRIINDGGRAARCPNG